MVLLAHHPELNLSDIWPDETTPAEFLAHVLRLIGGIFRVASASRYRSTCYSRSGSRASYAMFSSGRTLEPEELAAYFVLREFAASEVTEPGYTA